MTITTHYWPLSYSTRQRMCRAWRSRTASTSSTNQTRAAFIRAGVIAAKYRNELVIDAAEYYESVAEINRVCEVGHAAQWVADLGIGPSPLTTGDWFWDCKLDRVTVRIGNAIGVFTRGMLSELTLTLGEWYAVAGRALTRWPIGLLRISDVPQLEFSIVSPDVDHPHWRMGGYRLTGTSLLTSVSDAAACDIHAGAPPDRWVLGETPGNRNSLVANMLPLCEWIQAEFRGLYRGYWPPTATG